MREATKHTTKKMPSETRKSYISVNVRQAVILGGFKVLDRLWCVNAAPQESNNNNNNKKGLRQEYREHIQQQKTALQILDRVGSVNMFEK